MRRPTQVLNQRPRVSRLQASSFGKNTLELSRRCGRSFGLCVQHSVVHRLVEVELRFISHWINGGVWSLTDLREFILQVVHAALGAELHVGRASSADFY